MGIKVLSLFDGISCGMVALERAKVKVSRYVAYEIDKYAIQVSKKNYSQIEHCGDITKADFSQHKGFDLIIGGFPCQDLSIAKNNRKGLEGERSGLFWELVKAIETIKPKYFLVENNYGMPKEAKEIITKTLGVEPILINSALVSAQQRKRLYWTNIPNVNQPRDKGILLSSVLNKKRKWFPLQDWCFKYYGNKRKVDGLRTITSEKSFCLTTSKTHPRNYYLSEDRLKMTNILPEEAEILQTLPIGYTEGVSDTQRYKAIGNGWTVDVIAHILRGLKKEC